MTDDREYLEHIRIAATRVLEYTRDGRAAFEADFRAQDAVIRNIQVIGEAVKHLTANLRSANPQVPWRNITGTRNLVVHKYFLVDFALIWDVVEVHLPALLAEVNAIQANLPTSPQNTSRNDPDHPDQKST